MEKESLLLKKLSNGEEEAFNELFTYYYPKVNQFVFCLIKQANDAEDIVQDLFVKLWIHREVMAGIQSLNAYIYRLARNAVYDYFDHQVVRSQYEFLQEKKEESYTCTDEDFFALELEHLIACVVNKMPRQRQQIYRLSRESGFSNDEIASQLGVSKKTVENHLNLALNDIRQVLSGVVLFLYSCHLI